MYPPQVPNNSSFILQINQILHEIENPNTRTKIMTPSRALMGEIWGWRLYGLEENGTLKSPYRKDLACAGGWTTEPRRAVCGSYRGYVHGPSFHTDNRQEHVPTAFCGCGFYAFETIENLFKYGFPNRTHILARVKLWGKVIRCEYGYRSSWMEIDTVFLPWRKPIWPFSLITNGGRNTYHKVEEHFPKVQFFDLASTNAQNCTEIFAPFTEVPMPIEIPLSELSSEVRELYEGKKHGTDRTTE